MDKQTLKAELSKSILHDVGYLCRRIDRHWSAPIVKTLRTLKESTSSAVFFGGTIRSLLLSRLRNKGLGRPRDLDIVVTGTTISELRKLFASFVARETRFGGIQLRRENWQFDLWPLHKTWTFIKDGNTSPMFASLPKTTFFNLEAIAVDVWPKPGLSRNIYTADDQFFEGIVNRVLEINQEENPFPTLCVVRALVMASAIDFSIGPRLAEYLVRHGSQLSDMELESTQKKHYGHVRQYPDTLREWLRFIAKQLKQCKSKGIRLPLARQGKFWIDIEVEGHSKTSRSFFIRK